jgi:hypothetical protein
MKKFLIIVCTILGSINLTTAQIKELSCIISREDYTNFYVVSKTNDSIFVSKDSLGDRFIAANTHYKIIDGKGGRKDIRGDRERNKRYLINSNRDTLAVIKNDNEIIQINDSIIIRREETDYGWKYADNNGNVICDLYLLWNNTTWNYTIKYYDAGDYIEKLNKVILLSMVTMADYRSECPSTDNTVDDLLNSANIVWFALYMTKKGK